ncbi:MAG: UDP-2,3-diacylglucosamine diphosphatase [Smithellaceae bacterium]
MKAIFISDAHLKCARDERYVKLIHFLSDLQDGRVRELVCAEGLETGKVPIDDLFILGDFFDFWFCDKDKIYPEFQLIIQKLVELQKTGVRIHFCEGNHDFFLKEYFQNVLGMNVYEEWASIKLDQTRALLSHGDTADAGDAVYIAFRKLLRSRAFYHIQKLIPSSLRWAIANLTSKASKEINDDNSEYLVDKMISFATEKLRTEYDAVIMGHCHKPVLRIFEVDGKKKTFVTLGDWINHYSYLYYENRKFYLSYYLPR